MERVLVTGVKGMLGLDLMEALSGRYEACGRDIDDFDITREKETMDAITGIRPDIVIHGAAYTDVDGCESHIDLALAVNGGGTKNVAAACRKLGSKMVYISTDYVFDGTKSGAYSEEDPGGRTMGSHVGGPIRHCQNGLVVRDGWKEFRESHSEVGQGKGSSLRG
jgi:dTDP-4-dehydrorhamnose reductase